MTISSTTRKAGPFFGNNATIDFPFTFKVFKKQDVLVTLTNPSGEDQELLLDSAYSVTLNSNQDANPGGTVRYPISGPPLPVDWRLTTTGALPNTQPTDIQNNGGFFPQVVEDMGDRSTIQIQQLQEQVDRSLKFSVSDSGAGAVLPPADLRANKVLGFDATGRPVAVVPSEDSAAAVALALLNYQNDMAAGNGASLVGFIQAGAGAQPRTALAKMREWVSVSDFGAIADGTLHTLAERFGTLAAAQVVYPFVTSLTESIDGTAIQAALNAASALSIGVVRCQAGSGAYVVNRSVFMRPGVELCGDGRAVIKQANGQNLSTVIEFSTAHGASLRSLTVDGNRDNNNVDYGAALVHVRAANDAKVYDNVIKGACGYAIACNAARMSVIGNRIEDSFLHAIGVFGVVGQAARHLIIGNRIVRPCAGGILLGTADYSIVANNTFYAPIIGGRNNRLRVNISASTLTVTWVSGPNFADVRIGEVIVINGGMEFRVMGKVSNTQLTFADPDGVAPTLTNTLAAIGCGDLIGVLSQFCHVTGNTLVGGVTFGIGCTVGGNTVSTVGNRIEGNILNGQGKHALVVGWDLGPGGVYDTTVRGNIIYSAGDSGGNSLYDRIPIYLSGQAAGKVAGVFVEGNYVVGPTGDSQCPWWLGTDSNFEVGSVLVGRNYSTRMSNPGIYNDVLSIALSGWGSTATTTDIVSYGHTIRFTINCTGTGHTTGPAITVNKICDTPEQPAMVKADITTTTGTLGAMWGEHITLAGQWRATYYGTPAAGNLFTLTFRA